jgi:hypothetical protein
MEAPFGYQSAKNQGEDHESGCSQRQPQKNLEYGNIA